MKNDFDIYENDICVLCYHDKDDLGFIVSHYEDCQAVKIYLYGVDVGERLVKDKLSQVIENIKDKVEEIVNDIE